MVGPEGLIAPAARVGFTVMMSLNEHCEAEGVPLDESVIL